MKIEKKALNLTATVFWIIRRPFFLRTEKRSEKKRKKMVTTQMTLGTKNEPQLQGLFQDFVSCNGCRPLRLILAISEGFNDKILGSSSGPAFSGSIFPRTYNRSIK